MTADQHPENSPWLKEQYCPDCGMPLDVVERPRPDRSMIQRALDPNAGPQDPIGWKCLNCPFVLLDQAGDGKSIERYTARCSVTRQEVESLFAEDQARFKGARNGEAKQRRQPKAGEKEAWRNARRDRNQGAGGGPSGARDKEAIDNLTERLSFRTSPRRLERLRAVAKAQQVTVSDVINGLIDFMAEGASSQLESTS